MFCPIQSRIESIVQAIIFSNWILDYFQLGRVILLQVTRHIRLKERNHHNRKKGCRFIFAEVLCINKEAVADALGEFLAELIK